MNVVHLRQRRNREMVKLLEGLLEDAKTGCVQGVAFVIKLGPDKHEAGIAGDYEKYPEQAMQGVFAIERHLRADAGL